MLDIKFIRENKELIGLGAKKKHIDFDVEELIKIDDKRRELILTIEKKRAEQNEVSERIVRTSEQSEKSDMISKMQTLKSELQKEEEEMKTVMHEWQMLMVRVPNIPDMSVPEGNTEEDNKEMKTWGKFPNLILNQKVTWN